VSAIGGRRKAGRGRGRKTWLECVRRDIKEMGLWIHDSRDRQIGKVKFCQTSEPCKHKN